MEKAVRVDQGEFGASGSENEWRRCACCWWSNVHWTMSRWSQSHLLCCTGLRSALTDVTVSVQYTNRVHMMLTRSIRVAHYDIRLLR